MFSAETRNHAWMMWFANSPEHVTGTAAEGQAFNAGWRAAQAHLRTEALLTASPHESCSEMTRNALEAATDPSERTVTLTLDEIEALLCAWGLEEYPTSAPELQAALSSAEAKLKAAQPKETQ